MTVSYVLTVYNKAPFLPAVLSAVAAERDETGGEIIIIDDGSTDESPEILDRFASAGPNITILHQRNGGVVSATNAGLRAATGAYVRLIDGDDIIVRGSTEALLRALETTGCDYAFGSCAGYELGAVQADFAPAGLDVRSYIVSDPLAEMIRMQLFVVSATLGHKEVYDRVTPLPEEYYIQDTSLGLRVATTARVVRIEEVCCYMASSAPGRISGSKARMFRDTARITGAFFNSWPIRYRAAAVRRNAGRARHYARRHLPGSRLRCASLAAIGLLSYLPIAPLFPLWMGWIADTYMPAVRNPESYP